MCCVLKSGHFPMKHYTVAHSTRLQNSIKMTFCMQKKDWCTHCFTSTKGITQNRRHDRVVIISWVLPMQHMEKFHDTKKCCIMVFYYLSFHLMRHNMFFSGGVKHSVVCSVCLLIFNTHFTFSNISAVATSARTLMFLRFIDK